MIWHNLLLTAITVLYIFVYLYIMCDVMWHTTKYGDPYSEFVLCIYPILSAHTQQWTHTHREHTPGAVLYSYKYTIDHIAQN